MLTDEQPYFSVIMPVYNRAELVKQSIDSVLRQTFQDFELICINDGSTDNTLEVLSELEKIDSRIKVVSHENKGRCQARNSGIAHAKGKWIAFLDSDDFYLDNHLETLQNLIRRFPSFSGIATELVFEDRIRDHNKCRYYRDFVVLSLDDFADTNPISLNQFCYNKASCPDLLFPEINILAAEDLLFFRMFSNRYKILKSGIITNFVNTHENRSVNLISPELFVYWNVFATNYFIDNFHVPEKIEKSMRQYVQLVISNVYLSAKKTKEGSRELLKVLKYPSTYRKVLFYKALIKLFIN
ncbi:MAG: glycosyl transferase family 2 [Bacteroidetes bacterium OLB10]|nr:MAG: glycosyl transferase family 2 [Bacteroidetes bacterium OLB10]MBX3105859.1 glycosyltransferase family 2 protein [Bacteroidota bacterium]MCB0849252.1 glycosyltransferase family 2 protein [Bacteroidota bacterium]MCE7954934.1 glycosyltransferase family 2 protein [Bacteroidetes bacterium CHB6]MCW5930841.1 glycosyltransferase family 2 protein [Bacteroidota bacterium]